MRRGRPTVTGHTSSPRPARLVCRGGRRPRRTPAPTLGGAGHTSRARSPLPAACSNGNSAASWNIRATPPPTPIVPPVGRSRPATRLSRVDLPQPDAPIRQVNSPLATVRETSSRARTDAAPVPYTLETSRSVTAAVLAPPDAVLVTEAGVLIVVLPLLPAG